MKENPDQNGQSLIAPLLPLTAIERWALTNALIAIRLEGWPGEDADPEYSPELDEALDRVFEKLNPHNYDKAA